MKKTNFTSFKWLATHCCRVLPLLLLFLWGNSAVAQYCQLTCNDDVQVSLDQSCEAVILYDMILEDADNPATCSPNGPQAFKVDVMDASGNVMPTSPVVNSNHIGASLIVKVKHWATGNICWGSITVEDKQMPVISCPDVEIWCNEATHPDHTGRPTASDNCTPASQLVYSWWDNVTYLGCGTVGPNGKTIDAHIVRTWQVCDAQGNCASCEQDIYVLAATLSMVACPPDYDDLEQPALLCNATFATDDNGNPSPTVTGMPVLADHPNLPLMDYNYPLNNGQPFHVDYLCKINCTYADLKIDVCHGSYKVLRTWTCLDWCTGEILECTQIIKILDKQAPVVTCTDITLAVNPWTCTAAYNPTQPSVTDNCSENWYQLWCKLRGDVDGPYGTSSNGVISEYHYNGWQTWSPPTGVNLAYGDYTLEYTVVDDCQNQATYTCTITVVDNTPPVPVCDLHTQVILSPADCTAKIFAETFDDGSHDNCGLDKFEVTRMNQPNNWSDKVEFGVADACQTVMVMFRAWDGYGNVSEPCMVEVEVEDKTDPVLVCGPDKTIDCWDDPWDYFDEPTVTEACQVVSTTQSDFESIDNCGEGFVRRTWVSTDICGNTGSCAQTIFLEHVSDFKVKFPTDKNLTDDCTYLDDDDEPIIEGDDCELISVDYEDEVFTIVPDACYKIIRTWKVMNWCVADPDNLDPDGMIVSQSCLWRPLECQTPGDYRPGIFRWLMDDGDGYIEYKQIIKVVDMIPPTSTCESECIPATDDFDTSTANDCHKTRLTVTSSDNCTPDADLVYWWKIYDPSHTLIDQGNGSTVEWMYATKGDYTVHFFTEDKCGNIEECVHAFKHEDCKKPTPYCTDVNIELMPTTGMITVWAIDIDQGSFDNCTAQADLTFRIALSQGPGQTNPPAGSGPSITFDCSQLGTQQVDLWVGDECGNLDYCTTVIIVQDNMGACPGPESAMVAGAIGTEMDQMVQDVHVSAGAVSSMTSENGHYELPGLAMYENYTVTPEKNDDPMNGVSTFDLVLIQKHILGIDYLDSPYKIIAADVNHSNSVTTLDMVELRKIILQVYTEFPNNTSWRFVDATYVFADPANPFASEFPEVVSINDLSDDEQADFVGVKIGDVNNSAATSLAGSEDRNKSDKLVFDIDEMTFTNGQEVRVDFKATDFSNMLGYQFTLNFDHANLQFVDVVSGALNVDAANFGFSFLDQGLITTSWNDTKSINVQDGEVLFSLVFTGAANAQLSESISVNSRLTLAEAYNTDSSLDVALQFNTENGSTLVGGGFELYQNRPNPFKDNTQISFNLPEAGAVTLTVYDLSGKVLMLVNGEFDRGFNTIDINRSDLSGAGVLYYRLDTALDSAVKKMLQLD